MSQRAAWQLERLGFDDVYDCVVGKAHWLVRGRPTIRSKPIARVGSRVPPSTTASIDDSVAAIRESTELSDVVAINQRRIVLARGRRADLETADGRSDGRDDPAVANDQSPDELVRDVTTRMATPPT